MNQLKWVPTVIRNFFIGKAVIAGGTLILGAGLTTGYPAYVEWERKRNMANTILRGSCPPVDGHYVERPSIEAQLRPILKPDAPSDQFFLIMGEHGTGKSTIVRKVSTEKDVISGLLYVQLEGNSSLDKQLGQAFHYSPQKETFWGSIRHKLSYVKDSEIAHTEDPLDNVLISLKEQGRILFRRKKRPIVLIIDNYLMNEPKNLRTLQSFAKSAAAEGSVQIVFVSSEGKAPDFLAESGAKSRMWTYEIGDATEEEAKAYLSAMGFDPNLQKKILHLCGGRFVDLDSARLQIMQRKNTFEEFRQSLFAARGVEFGLLRRKEYSEGLVLASVLLKKDYITMQGCIDILPETPIRESILRSHVFATHLFQRNPEDDDYVHVTFQSTAMKRYAEMYFQKNTANLASKGQS